MSRDQNGTPNVRNEMSTKLAINPSKIFSRLLKKKLKKLVKDEPASTYQPNMMAIKDIQDYELATNVNNTIIKSERSKNYAAFNKNRAINYLKSDIAGPGTSEFIGQQLRPEKKTIQNYRVFNNNSATPVKIDRGAACGLGVIGSCQKKYGNGPEDSIRKVYENLVRKQSVASILEKPSGGKSWNKGSNWKSREFSLPNVAYKVV
jgi:hypothetical protein